MKTNKILSLFLAICFVLLSATPAFAQGEESAFSGSRTTVFTIDYSDLENFVEGGRSAFDLALRKQKPDWLNATVTTKGRDLYLSFSFAFSTFEDYKAKLAELLTAEPAIVYSNSDGVMLIESFSASELLNFINYALLAETNSFTEFKIEELFKISANTLTVNGESYNQEERICIIPESQETVKFDTLEIITTAADDGSFSRTITVSLNTENVSEKEIALVEKRFKSVGNTTNEEGYYSRTLTVDFTAHSLNELSTKTIQCLNVACAVTESLAYKEGTTVTVTRSEFIDWESLKSGEYSRISLKYIAPESHANLSIPEDETTQINENEIYTDSNTLICFYERAFSFNRVVITTDFSALNAKVTKKIDFVAPTYIVSNFHSKIKKTLTDKLTKGCTLNIYDEGSMRHYEVSFSSWFNKELNEFSTAYLGSNIKIKRNESLVLPFVKNSIKESGQVKSIFGSGIKVDNVSTVYVFSKNAKIHTNDSDYVITVGEKLILTADWGNQKISVNFEYQRFNIFKCIIIGLILIIVTVAIILSIHFIKKAKTKLKENPKPKLKKKDKSADSPKKANSDQDVPASLPMEKLPFMADSAPDLPQTPADTTDSETATKKQFVSPLFMSDFTVAENNAPKEEKPVTADEQIPEAPQICCPVCATMCKAGTKFCRKCGSKLI